MFPALVGYCGVGRVPPLWSFDAKQVVDTISVAKNYHNNGVKPKPGSGLRLLRFEDLNSLGYPARQRLRIAKVAGLTPIWFETDLV